MSWWHKTSHVQIDISTLRGGLKYEPEEALNTYRARIQKTVLVANWYRMVSPVLQEAQVPIAFEE
jgi:hypothetical protein